jgi:phosphoglycolate phosphatase
MLYHLESMGLPLAVHSNKPHEMTRKLADHFFGKERFVKVMGKGNHLPPKPDPAGALEISKACGVPACDCLYVGDSDIDMKTADAAGMKRVGVTWGFREREELREAGADFLVDDPSELIEIIKVKI